MMIRKLMRGNRTIPIENIDEMAHFAANFSQNVTAGDFIALTGTLGSGKTTFTRFFCQALGIHQPITSPTFTLLNEYEASTFRVLHGDLYRLTDREIEASLPELENYLEAPGIMVLMEWADKAPQLEYRWTWHLDFAFFENTDTARQITITSVYENPFDEHCNMTQNQ